MKKVVAKAIIINESGELLFLYRGLTHPKFPGHLDLPGGEVENAEEWKNAVKREIAEETSLEINKNTLSKVLEKSYTNVTHVLYTAKIDSRSPKPILSWEHSGYRWYSINDLLNEPIPIDVDPYYDDAITYLKTTV